MKRTSVLLLMIALAAGGLSAQDAAEIVRSSRSRITANTISTRARMVITARDRSTTERMIDQYSKDGPNGGRQVIVFQQPASVRGTRFLTMENAQGGNDQWIFLPALNRVRRIAASEGSGSFMGTDFSYDDIAAASRNVSLDAHRVLREEALNGRPCYVIESVPNDPSFQYSKMIQWIDRETHLLYKLELYNRRNALTKTIEMGNYRDVQGRMTAHSTKIASAAEGTSTELVVEIIKYDDNIPESVFTTTYLETGRAR
jgi:outer membrane lipoprotein-sorting protein